MKKQTEQKSDRVRATVWLSRDVWKMARVAALDKGVPFGRYVEAALVAYKGGKS
jgi:hypothetical protein